MPISGSAVLPTLFLSHGAPPLADDPIWPAELAAWSARLPTPEAVLMVSAHWEAAPVTVSATAPGLPLVYDFWGFPNRYYQVRYPAPPAPALADRVTELLAADTPVARDQTRGLDHGAYVPLVEMYPEADVPVVQLSLPTLQPGRLLDLGRKLAPLRAEGVLVIGSGFTTHNLRWFNPSRAADAAPPTPSAEFDAWAAEAIASGDLDALLAAERHAPGFALAHPRTEHWAPLYVALGAADPDGTDWQPDTTVEGFWFGLSKRSWQFGAG